VPRGLYRGVLQGKPGELQGIEGPGKGDEGRIGGKVESFGLPNPEVPVKGGVAAEEVGYLFLAEPFQRVGHFKCQGTQNPPPSSTRQPS